MNSFRIARCLACFTLLLTLSINLLGSSAALAAEGDASGSAPPSEKELESGEPPVKLTCKFPSVKGIAEDIFEFEIFIEVSAEEYAGKYEFNVITPPGWKAGVWTDVPEKRVSSIDFGGEPIYHEPIIVKASPLAGQNPEPGEYLITLDMESGDIKVSTNLTAVVTHSYEFEMDTETGRLNAQVKAGEDNHISILLINTGTGAVENIALSSDKPEGWSITFNPKKIDIIEPDVKQKVDAMVSPPKEATPGDYLTIVKAKNGNSSDSLILRITVTKPRAGGGPGIGISVGVIAGLAVLFAQLRRRGWR